MIMVEEWWSSLQKQGCVWVTHFKHRSLPKYARGARWSRGREHDRSSAGEEGYAAICAECEHSKKNLTRPLRPPCYTM